MLIFRSLLFYLGQWSSLLLFAPLALLSAPLSLRTRVRLISGWARFQVLWLRWVCGLSYRVRFEGALPDGPFVLLSKHQSAWETLAFQAIFPPCVWVLKRELLRIPLFGWGLAMTGPIAIDRSAGRKALDQLVTQGSDRLNRGLCVVVFPEGTRVAPGARGRYNFGGALLASRSHFPVVPVAHNAGVFWTRNAFVKHPGVIDVVVGPALMTESVSAKKINGEVELWIEQTMATLPTTPR